MKLFQMHEIDLPLDEKDLPLDELDIPLSMQIKASADLDNKFDINDAEFDAINNISPQINDQDLDIPEDNFGDELPENEMDDGTDERDMPLDMENNGEEGETSKTEEQSVDDPNFQGIIRTVKGACLVYKRQNAENTYDELWIFNVGKDMKSEYQTKKAILAGTDINPQGGESEDGKQMMDTYSVGNVSFLSLEGLPN